MGKGAKEKKRRKKAFRSSKPSVASVKGGNVLAADRSNISDASEDDDDDDSDADLSEDGIISEADNMMSIRILNVLGQRLDFYESKSMKCLRTALFPLIELQISKGSHFEINKSHSFIDGSDSKDEFINRKLPVLTRTAATYNSDRELFLSADTKSFRAALHPLVLVQQRRMSKKIPGSGSVEEAVQTFSSRVSEAFRSRNWSLALHHLYEMHQSSEFPKLEQSAEEKDSNDTSGNSIEEKKNTCLLLLDAVMRVASPKIRHGFVDMSVKAALPSTAVIHHYQMSEDMKLDHIALSISKPEAEENYVNFRAEKVKVLSHVPGAMRRPPSDTDLNIFSIAPNTISFKKTDITAVRIDVPKVNGTFLMQNVLSNEECSRLISVAEAIGYSHDAVAGIDNIVLYADPTLLGPIFQRCRHLLPQKGLSGLNSRFRFFRYKKGAVYRPHIDGSWPGSGLVNGEYVDDAFGGKHNSKLTFLIYLNGDEDFEGGSTTFFLPADERGHIEARAVHPQRGAVLVFPHGEVTSPVHEGSEISEGSQKYVIRTDVLYRTAET